MRFVSPRYALAAAGVLASVCARPGPPRMLGSRRVWKIRSYFAEPIILWPFAATGVPEHQRRLLYNAVTRARAGARSWFKAGIC